MRTGLCFFHEEFRISWDDLGNFKQKHGGILTTVKCVPAANSVAFFVLFFSQSPKKSARDGHQDLSTLEAQLRTNSRILADNVWHLSVSCLGACLNCGI
jgi:hypothetical protein